jgi:bifunctional oligoribonuclease and PAP phosphatase NrnA
MVNMKNQHDVKNNIDFHGVLNWIKEKRSILLTAHRRPDGDALGSLFGLHRCLKDLRLKSTVFVDESLPERYQSFAPPGLLIDQKVDLNDFDALICLDAANESRLALPNDLTYDEIHFPTCNLDHHLDNGGYGQIHYIDAECSATAELLTLIAMKIALPISPETATSLLLGIVTDTGGFRFNNTTAQTLKTAAWLIERGADHDDIMTKMFYSESYSMLKLQAKIWENMRFGFDNRLAYFFLTPELLSSYGIDTKDTEDIIDSVRVIRGAEIICRLQQTDNGIRYSLRSQNPELPVIEIAHQLGGGGHRLAAGAFIKDVGIEEGEQLLLTYAKAILFEK